MKLRICENSWKFMNILGGSCVNNSYVIGLDFWVCCLRYNNYGNRETEIASEFSWFEAEKLLSKLFDVELKENVISLADVNFKCMLVYQVKYTQYTILPNLLYHQMSNAKTFDFSVELSVIIQILSIINNSLNAVPDYFENYFANGSH